VIDAFNIKKALKRGLFFYPTELKPHINADFDSLRTFFTLEGDAFVVFNALAVILPSLIRFFILFLLFRSLLSYKKRAFKLLLLKF